MYKRQTILAQRGHQVDLFDAAAEIGGQLNMAKVVPGKEEFHETLRYYQRQIELTGVALRLNTQAEPSMLSSYDEIVIATGVTPRNPKIPGQDNSRVLSYIDVLRHQVPVGEQVLIIGAGGIGFDVAEFLAHTDSSPDAHNLASWLSAWGVADPSDARGGVVQMQFAQLTKQITLLQRTNGKLGAKLGKTTGWIHRATLRQAGVQMVAGLSYEEINDDGLQVRYADGSEEIMPADQIILCAGQVPRRDLYDALAGLTNDKGSSRVHLIGGAHEASELDAKRAINQGSRLAARL